MTFHIKQNDTSPPLQYRLTDAAGQPLNLAGATVTFHMAAVPHESIIDGSAVTKLEELGGLVEYTWQPGDTASAGRMKGEFKAVLPDGRNISVPNKGYIDIFIESELG